VNKCHSVVVHLISDIQLQTKTAHVGEEVHIPCGDVTTGEIGVDWDHKPSENARSHKIIAGGHNVNGAHVQISRSTLIIPDVKINDSGIYICTEDAGIGPEHHIRLTVLGKWKDSILLD